MSLFGKSGTNGEGKISVVAQIRAKSGNEDTVRSALDKLAGPSRQEPGCLRYNIFEDAHYTGSFFTYEEWESEAALEEHLRVNKAALDKAKALLSEDMRISVLKALA